MPCKQTCPMERGEWLEPANKSVSQLQIAERPLVRRIQGRFQTGNTRCYPLTITMAIRSDSGPPFASKAPAGLSRLSTAQGDGRAVQRTCQRRSAFGERCEALLPCTCSNLPKLFRQHLAVPPGVAGRVTSPGEASRPSSGRGNERQKSSRRTPLPLRFRSALRSRSRPGRCRRSSASCGSREARCRRD